MKRHSRLWRRFHAQRMKLRAHKIFPNNRYATHANHLRLCSHACCGNPRRHFNRKTLQEQKHYLDYLEYTQELEENS